jgi:hypothetical protein
MKLLCVSNTITVSKGFFNREKVTELVKGITVGKKYEGQIVPIVDRYTWSEHQTTISGCKNCEHKLVVFDIMRDGQYSNSEQVRGWCVRYQMDMVPILYEGEFDYEQAKALTIGDSVLCPLKRLERV